MDVRDAVGHIGSTDADLAAGQTVGEYVVAAKIGQGGFGTVYRAEHPLIGKQAAIKVLGRQYSSDPDMVSRFVAEARAVNQIRHRNIIDIFGFGKLEDGRHYYVMEFLDGRPFDEVLAERGGLPVAEAMPILRQVAQALDAAHAKGIAHRDLKPENVFLASDDGGPYPKLLDFGIAKLLRGDPSQTHRTRTGAPMGTPYYMSPEQCRGRDVDHRTDIYALGCVVYRVLTGAYPFDGPDYMEILIKQLHEQPVPPSELVADLPPAIDEAIAAMLHKDPAGRPATCGAALRAIEEAARGGGEAAAPAASPSRASSSSSVSPSSSTSPSSSSGAASSSSSGSGASSRSGASSGPETAPRAAVATTAAPATAGSAATATDVATLPTLASATATDVATLPTLASATAPPMVAVAVAGRDRGRWPVLVLGLATLIAVGLGGALWLLRDGASAAAPAVPGASAAAPGLAGGPAAAAGPAGNATSPAAQAAPPVPALVALEIRGAPAGTEVHGPRGLIGLAPGKVQLERGERPITLVFKAEGHRTAAVEVVPAADEVVDVELAPLATGRPAGHGRPGRRRDPDRGAEPVRDRRNSIEDPFKQ